MAPFQILEHTGEVGVLAQGETRVEAFGEAARGMFSLMASLGSIEESQVEVCDAAGLSKKVARMRPLGVIKG